MFFRLAHLSLFLSFILLLGCTATPVAMQSDSTHIEVSTLPPGHGYTQRGPITARHGGGCGLYGSRGDFEGAMNILRNRAAELDAEYVHILSQQGEHMKGICLDRSYTINGMAYQRTK